MRRLLDPGAVIDGALRACAAAVVMLAVSWWNLRRLPPPAEIRPELRRDPAQAAAAQAPFELERRGYRYRLEPRATYDLYGLVVAKHRSSSWLDNSHEEWRDYLNTEDLCVLWGDNVASVDYRRMSFSHGDWTCYYEYAGSAGAGFRKDQMGNNHLIPADDAVARAIDAAQIGDQVRVRGLLTDYRNEANGAGRATNLARGTGVCEVVYVTEYATLASHNALWLSLWRASQLLGEAALGAFALAFFVLPYIAP